MELHGWGPRLAFVPGRSRAVYYDDAVDGQLRCEDVPTWCREYWVNVPDLHVFDGKRGAWVLLDSVRRREARRGKKVRGRLTKVTRSVVAVLCCVVRTMLCCARTRPQLLL